MRAKNEEECIGLEINTVVSAHDQKAAATLLGPEETISARSDLTDEETEWLRLKWNLDRNLNNAPHRTAREREYLSCLLNHDSNDGDKSNS